MTATLWWTLTLALMLAGLAGTLLPVLPGTTVILAAAIMHHLALGEARSIGWWGIAGLVVLTVLSYVVDFGSAALGAKQFVKTGRCRMVRPAAILCASPVPQERNIDSPARKCRERSTNERVPKGRHQIC